MSDLPCEHAQMILRTLPYAYSRAKRRRNTQASAVKQVYGSAVAIGVADLVTMTGFPKAKMQVQRHNVVSCSAFHRLGGSGSQARQGLRLLLGSLRPEVCDQPMAALFRVVPPSE